MHGREEVLTRRHQRDDCDEQCKGACWASHQVACHVIVLYSAAWHPLAFLHLQCIVQSSVNTSILSVSPEQMQPVA